MLSTAYGEQSMLKKVSLLGAHVLPWIEGYMVDYYCANFASEFRCRVEVEIGYVFIRTSHTGYLFSARLCVERCGNYSLLQGA